MRRRKPDNTAEMLIFILLLIPIAAYYLLKWIIKGLTAICVWAYNKKCISSPVSPINANINGRQSEYVSTNSISSEAQKCHESDNIDLRPQKPANQATTSQMAEETVNLNTEGGDNEMATILTAGLYVFGKNTPNGMYDLVPVKGGGHLTIYGKDGDESFVWLGEHNDGIGAKEYKGLDSELVKRFTLEGNVEVKITKAQMIVIDG